MKTIAVICEYNPLHFGHLYHINQIREHYGECAVIALLSGDFVQRGEPAVLTKTARARAAVSAGCDLVFELPAPYCFASAEHYARAGVKLAASLGADVLSFGSESGELAKLQAAAKRLASPAFSTKLNELAKKEPALGIVSARAAAARESGLETFSGLITAPNNILALEYIKAVNKLGMKQLPELHTVRRIGAGYNSLSENDGFVSASFIRSKIFAGEEFKNYLPDFTYNICMESLNDGIFPTSLKRLELPILCFFRLADAKKLSEFAESGGGLSYRLCRAAREADSLEAFFEAAATKKYTNARLRRAVLSCMLGIYESDLRAPPAFTRLLAASANGRSLLNSIRPASDIEILTSAADFKKLPQAYERARALYRTSEALYTLAFQTPRPASDLIKARPYIAKN